MKWWYAIESEQKGPVSQEELELLWRQGMVNQDTRVWREGLTDWVSMGTQFNETVTPTESHQRVSAQNTMVMAGPWRRYFARYFDLLLECFMLGLGIGALISFFPALQFLEEYTDKTWFIWPVFISLASVLDALIYTVFGNTLGKVIWRLSVRTADGKKMSFLQYVFRNIKLVVMGLGLGIPIVNLLTMVKSYQEVKSGHPTAYDRKDGFIVLAKPVGAWRYVFITLSFVMMWGVIIFSSVSRTRMVPEPPLATTSYETWLNPATQVKVDIPTYWSYQLEQSQENTVDVFRFSEPSDRIAVVFGGERVQDWTIEDYAKSFMEVSAEDMSFNDDSSVVAENQGYRWKATARSKVSPTVRIKLEILKIEENFWRLIVYQSQPYENTDEAAEIIHRQLWKSVIPES